MKTEIDKDKMLEVFLRIRDAFPDLTMHFDVEPAQVDIYVAIPEQQGLAFPVDLNLQGDELHLSAGEFWQEWFPCTQPEVVEQYVAAVSGLLSGEDRIVEHLRGTKVLKAELQRPNAAEWETIARWSRAHMPFFGPTSTRIKQNAQPAPAR